eukprot:1387641-Alexandrium_andersonii.AAC.1
MPGCNAERCTRAVPEAAAAAPDADMGESPPEGDLARIKEERKKLLQAREQLLTIPSAADLLASIDAKLALMPDGPTAKKQYDEADRHLKRVQALQEGRKARMERLQADLAKIQDE